MLRLQHYHTQPAFFSNSVHQLRNVAASFNGNCKTCTKVYNYNYYGNCPLPESDSNKDLKYFQVSNKTMFETYSTGQK